MGRFPHRNRRGSNPMVACSVSIVTDKSDTEGVMKRSDLLGFEGTECGSAEKRDGGHAS